MKTAVVYESMFGATRAVAEAIAEGLAVTGMVQLVRAAEADATVLEGVDLVVVGAPTHARGMPRSSTRKGGPDYVTKSAGGLALEPGADTDPGVREWLAATSVTGLAVAAFDTRIDMPAVVSGRASRSIARALKRHGGRLVVPAQSFLVDKKSDLLPGQIEQARAWGSRLARTDVGAGIGPN